MVVGVSILDLTGKILTADRAARDLVQLDGRGPGTVKMLDGEGRPYRWGAVLPRLEPGVTFSSIRGFKYERAEGWRWLHNSYLRTGGQILVQTEPLRPEDAPRPRAFECETCPALTMAAAECASCERQLCLTCWVCHPGCAPRRREQRVGAHCPLTDARLIHHVAGQVDLEAWCDATKGKRSGPCWPECDSAEQRLKGWLTASGRFRLPNGDQ